MTANMLRGWHKSRSQYSIGSQVGGLPWRLEKGQGEHTEDAVEGAGGRDDQANGERGALVVHEG